MTDSDFVLAEMASLAARGYVVCAECCHGVFVIQIKRARECVAMGASATLTGAVYDAIDSMEVEAA